VNDEELERIAHAIDNFDPEAASDECEDSDDWPECLACGGQYRVDVGLNPTALDNDCAHDALVDFARAHIRMLDQLRAPVLSTEEAEALRYLVKLAREVLADIPPVPGEPNTERKRVEDNCATISKLLDREHQPRTEP